MRILYVDKVAEYRALLIVRRGVGQPETGLSAHVIAQAQMFKAGTARLIIQTTEFH